MAATGRVGWFATLGCLCVLVGCGDSPGPKSDVDGGGANPNAPGGKSGDGGPSDAGSTGMDGAASNTGADASGEGGGLDGAVIRKERAIEAQMLSVAPGYTLSGDSYSYTPRHTMSGEAEWEVAAGPSGMEMSDGRLRWEPTADDRGEYEVELRGRAGEEEVRQTFRVRVSASRERAAEEFDGESPGQVSVRAPTSEIRGAGVRVESGGLEEPRRLSVNELEEPPEFANTRRRPRTVDFGPSGTVFREPATVTLPFDKSDDVDPRRLGAFTYNPKTGRWERVRVVSVDEENGTLRARASHFSIYAAAELSLDLSVTVNAMDAGSICGGELVARVELASSLSDVELGAVNSLTTEMQALGATNVHDLLVDPGFHGSLKFVRVVQLGRGQGDERAPLKERLWVSTLYADPETGGGILTHTDSTGNVIQELTYADVAASIAEISTHLRGLSTHKRLQLSDDEAYNVGGRLHILYSPADATRVGASLGNLGAVTVDVPYGEDGLADPVSAGFDVDCDEYRAPFDTVDNSPDPRIAFAPEEGVSFVEGGFTTLRAEVVESEAGPSESAWTVDGEGGSLAQVEGDPHARSFTATTPGFYSVIFTATADGIELEKRFSVEVLEAPSVNTLPTCVPTAASNETVEGDALSVTAAVNDAETPDDVLTVEWGLAASGEQGFSLVPSLSVAGEGIEASFSSATAGSYLIGCRAHDGTGWGPVGVTEVGVLAPEVNRGPQDAGLSPLAETLVVGEAMTFRAEASDPEGDALTFTWSGDVPLGVPTTSGNTASYAVDTTGMSAGSYTVRVRISDGTNPAVELEAELLVLAQSIAVDEPDADGDGYPVSTDCNDTDATIHPGAKDICGDAIDQDCDGTALTLDCDEDGFASEADGGDDCDDGDRYRNPDADELCDGIDNNCDGSVDEGYAVGAQCTVGTGSCQSQGTTQCSPNGLAALCSGTPLASSAEVCDGSDNDCDGLTDEANICVTEKAGAWFQCTTDTCETLGDEGVLLLDSGAFHHLSAPSGSATFDPGTQQYCEFGTGTWTLLEPQVMQVSTPSDDGGTDVVEVTFLSIDGEQMVVQFIDEEQVQQQRYRRVGDAAMGACEFDPRCEPLPEICNGSDDDCDGLVDENDVCSACACDVSASCDPSCVCDPDCSGSGTGGCAPSSEICDGLDNNCDGVADEGGICGALFDGSDSLLGIRWMCAEPGCTSLDETGFMFMNDGSFVFLRPIDGMIYDTAEPYCADGGGTWTRRSPTEFELMFQDDDGPVTLPITTSQVGGFEHWSTMDPETGGPMEFDVQPVPENSAGACPARDAGPDCSQTEICNGFDDDCDGFVDEGFTPEPEMCDGTDNDCDGRIDNLDTPCTVPAAMGQCALGAEVCEGLDVVCQGLHGPSTEYCEDGLDSDCDGDAGLTEDGCQALPPGEGCASALDASAGGVFADSLVGALDLHEAGCSAYPGAPERVFRLDVPEGGAGVFLGVRATSAPACDNDTIDNDMDGTIDELGEPCGGEGMPMPSHDFSVSVTDASCGPETIRCFGGDRLEPVFLEQGSYFILVESGMGSVDFELSVAFDTDGACTPPDGDADGQTICQGDCNDANDQTFLGAREQCDGLDNDCNGAIDDLNATCTVDGQFGACAVGRAHCEGSTEVCDQVTFPAPSEYCGDGADNDCDGQTDEAGCVTLPAGELCGAPLSVSLGSTFSGTLAGAVDNGGIHCGDDARPELYYRFDVASPTQALIGVRDLGCGCDADPDVCDAGCGCDAACATECTCDTMPDMCECECDVDCGGGAPPMGDSGLQWKLTRGGCGETEISMEGCEWAEPGRLELRDRFLDPGTYYMIVEGPEGTAFDATLAENSEAGCVPGDTDGDGWTVCDGDCSEGDNGTFPGAVEVCDGSDNDCDGMVDEAGGDCTVEGQLGVCANGRNACEGLSATCEQLIFPGERTEVCSDLLDNDCDGQVDEAECTALPPGEVCSLAIDASAGGTFQASLNGATDDGPEGCNDPMFPEVYFTFTVPDLNGGGDVDVNMHLGVGAGASDMVSAELINGTDCAGEGFFCMDRGSHSWMLMPGSYTVAVTGPEPVDVTFTVGWRDTGEVCSPIDLDADGFTVCDGDCFEGNGTIAPNQVEICDGLDNNCNGQADDVQGPCTVPTALGECQQGQRACDGEGEICQQVRFPGDSPEWCDDGLDNDCDGEADTADPEGCQTPAPGEVCASAIDVSEGGVFPFSLNAATNDHGEQMCGDPAAPEMFFTFSVSGNETEVFWEVRESEGGEPLGELWTYLYDGGCTGDFRQCTGPEAMGEFLPAGTYVLVVEGMHPGSLELRMRFRDEFGNCTPPDGDLDGVSLCDGDCNDNDPNVSPGEPESCDGVDNNCDGQIDNLNQPCSTGLPGICDQGQTVCNGPTTECQGLYATGEQAEVCGDGLDNDCDEVVDEPEPDCVQPPAGESCQNALTIPQGPVSDVLDTAQQDYGSLACSGFGPGYVDKVWFFQVTGSGADFQIDGPGEVMWDLFSGACGEELSPVACFGGGYSAPLSPGDYYLVATGDPGSPIDFQVTLNRWECGDGIRQAAEECDDGNIFSGDGCSAECLTEP